MGGFIILDDGRAYAASNWAFRATVESIAAALPDTTEANELAEWLQTDPVVQVYHSVDVRGLTPTYREMLLKAAKDAFAIEQSRGPATWSEPDYFPGWLNRFADLVKMIECVERGEPPARFNPHMNDVIPPSGEQVGPGR